MRTFRHWTPRYIADRLRLWAHQRRNPHDPWITPQATRLLSTMLLPSDIGLEWGSGRSTVWLARRIRHLTSVEHEPSWYNHVKQQLADAGLSNVTYLFLEHPAPDGQGQRQYVGVCEQFADESLNFVLVDAAVRELCALAAMPKIAPGGLLVIDNVDTFVDHPSRTPAARFGKGHLNDNWGRVYEQLKNWRVIWTTSGVTDTAICIKSAS